MPWASLTLKERSLPLSVMPLKLELWAWQSRTWCFLLVSAPEAPGVSFWCQHQNSSGRKLELNYLEQKLRGVRE